MVFSSRILQKLGVPENDADITARILVATDIRGIESHGVAHLGPIYVSQIKQGTINVRSKFNIAGHTNLTAVMDGDAGLGFVAGHHAMMDIIGKAKKFLEIARKKGIVKNLDEFCDMIAKESVRIYAPTAVYNFLKRYTLFSPDRLCDQIEKEHGRVNTINKLAVKKEGNLAEFNYYYDKEYLEGKKEQVRRDLCKTTEYIIREIFEFANATDVRIKE